MDDWGDPWAEDNPDRGTKKELRIFVGSKREAASEELGNEAQWGEDDEFGDFEGWSDLRDPGTAGQRVEAVSAAEQDGEPLNNDRLTSAKTHYGGSQESSNGKGDDPYSFELSVKHENSIPEEREEVPPGCKGSETVLDPDTKTTAADTVSPAHSIPLSLARDGSPAHDVSAEPSVSPSEVSTADLAHESPRTSFDDDYTTAQTSKPIGREDGTFESLEEATSDKDAVSAMENDFGDFEDNVGMQNVQDELKPPASSIKEAVLVSTYGSVEASGEEAIKGVEATGITSDVHDSLTASFNLDLSIVKQLFPVPAPSHDLTEVDGDIISSTSARKAWYRITRKETMREYNKGEDDDRYVRVGWQGSTIRAQTTAIVARWAAEDRIHGRVVLGGRSSAMFGWDESGKGHSGTSGHMRRSLLTLPTTPQRELRPHTHKVERREVDSAPTGPVAQFSWSSPPVAERKPQDTMQPRSGPLAESPVSVHPRVMPSGESLVASLVPHNMGRPVSLERSNRGTIAGSHKRTTESISHVFSSSQRSSIDEMLNLPNAAIFAPESVGSVGAEPGGPKMLDSGLDPEPSITTDSIAKQLQSLDRLDPTEDKILSTNLPQPSLDALAPSLAMPTDDQDDEWGEMIESPIASSSSNAVSFFTEKPVLHSTSVSFGKAATIPSVFDTALPPVLSSQLQTCTALPLPRSAQATPTALESAAQDLSSPALETASTLALPVLSPSPPTPAIPTLTVAPRNPPPLASQPSSSALTSSFTSAPDPLMDADFSIFESPPAPARSVFPAPVLIRPSLVPERPFGRHPPSDSRARSAKPASLSRFELTTATRSRDEEIVRRIVDGLPDLRYMLR